MESAESENFSNDQNLSLLIKERWKYSNDD